MITSVPTGWMIHSRYAGATEPLSHPSRPDLDFSGRPEFI